MMSATIETTRTADHLTIKIPTKGLDDMQIQRFLDLIKFESIIGKSQLTQDDADEIASDIKRSWWNANKDRIEKMIGGVDE